MANMKPGAAQAKLAKVENEIGDLQMALAGYALDDADRSRLSTELAVLQRRRTWYLSRLAPAQPARKASPTKRGPRRPPRPAPPPPPPPPSPQRIELVAPPQAVSEGVLDERAIEGDDIMLGQLGLVSPTLTVEQERVLSEPPPVARVRFLPQRHPVMFLAHTEYTRLLNRAFGRFGWALVPIGRPSFDAEKRCIVCPYVLHINGAPVAAAWGQQEYHASNADQTFGDAVESTVASALRRCCKRIGVWLELWDYDWRERMTRELGVCVTVTSRDGKELKSWRRKDDAPFWNEQQSSRRQAPAPRPAPPAQTPKSDNPEGDKPITPAAAKKLWDTAKRMRRSVPEVAVWLTARYGVAGSAELKRQDYNAIIAALEAPGPLQLPREPGDDDE